jgi:hypothetical protein
MSTPKRKATKERSCWDEGELTDFPISFPRPSTRPAFPVKIDVTEKNMPAILQQLAHPEKVNRKKEPRKKSNTPNEHTYPGIIQRVRRRAATFQEHEPAKKTSPSADS